MTTPPSPQQPAYPGAPRPAPPQAQYPPVPPYSSAPPYSPAAQYPPAPQQPSAAQYPPAAPQPQPTRVRRRNPVALASVIVLAIALLAQLLVTIATGAMLTSRDVPYRFYDTITTVAAVLQGLLAITAVVLASIGLAARERPKALAGIGLGGAVTMLCGLFTTQLMSVLLSVSLM